MNNMIDAIRDDGQPFENAWPYMDELPTNIGEYVPPSQPSAVFRRRAHRAVLGCGRELFGKRSACRDGNGNLNRVYAPQVASQSEPLSTV